MEIHCFSTRSHDCAGQDSIDESLVVTEIEGLGSLSALSHSACLRDGCFCRIYAGGMRYPDGGGLTAEGRARREKVRLQAAQMFEQGMDLEQVAKCLRVST